MSEKKPEISFKLGRIENLDDNDRTKVDELPKEMAEGLFIKEYSPNSFVKVKRFLPANNLYTAQVKKELNENGRQILKKHIDKNLEF
ncbi:hypothetical protein HYX06_02485 [Candidatus Woesearchaeota archaeon]|nr:hypothetical protein [Candidatus Woesearchaeota archaeon]